MNAVVVAQLINAAFSIIAGLRRMGATNLEITARLDAVDAGGDAISVAEVQSRLDDFQAEIDRGRGL